MASTVIGGCTKPVAHEPATNLTDDHHFIPNDPLAPAPLDKGVRIDLGPSATNPNREAVQVQTSPNGGVDVKIDGEAIRERLRERRETAPVTP